MYERTHYPGPRSGVHFSTAPVYSFLPKVLLLKRNIRVVVLVGHTVHYTNKLVSRIAPLLPFKAKQ